MFHLVLLTLLLINLLVLYTVLRQAETGSPTVIFPRMFKPQQKHTLAIFDVGAHVLVLATQEKQDLEPIKREVGQIISHK